MHIQRSITLSSLSPLYHDVGIPVNEIVTATILFLFLDNRCPHRIRRNVAYNTNNNLGQRKLCNHRINWPSFLATSRESKRRYKTAAMLVHWVAKNKDFHRPCELYRERTRDWRGRHKGIFGSLMCVPIPVICELWAEGLRAEQTKEARNHHKNAYYTYRLLFT